MDAAPPLGAAVTPAHVRHAWRLALCLLVTLVPGAAAAGEHYALLVSGAPGGETYAARQQKWSAELAAFLTATFDFPEANLVRLEADAGGSSRATADNVRRVLGDLRRRATRDDVVFVVLIGHGTYDGVDAKFNLVGPDLTASEWQALFDGLAARLVLVNTTASSFPFLEQLSGPRRVIITATDSAQQRYATVFPEYFIRALADRSSDLDKNGRVSVWEAFASASAGVREHYEQRGQLTTERPMLDDNGDRVGREADAPGEDGAVARAIFLDPDPRPAVADPALAALERQRSRLEQQLEELKKRKGEMPEDRYQAELERIAVELARIAQQIRERS